MALTRTHFSFAALTADSPVTASVMKQGDFSIRCMFECKQNPPISTPLLLIVIMGGIVNLQ
jgi:hypothetical protein